MIIVIAVCTYRRPASLERLLHSIAALDPVPPGRDEAVHLHVVVVDNDDAAEGLRAAEQLEHDLPFDLSTGRATTQGLSAARNLAVALALAMEPELVAFLDDDEWPDAQWLAELVRVQRETAADAVGGPTRSVFPEHARPEQIGNGYYGADLGIADGARCQLEAGGNFLIRASTLDALGAEPFDSAFAHSGGEDLAFFTELTRRGRHMHWAAHASVNETVPDERLVDGWMRQRVINIANSRVRVMQRYDASIGASMVRILKTTGLGAVAGLLSIAGLANPALADKARLLRWKFHGKLSAHLGRITAREELY